MLTPTTKSLVKERTQLTTLIRQSADKTPRKKASLIQQIFLIPLHALIAQYKVASMTLGICCLAMLMFPIHADRHHILEIYIQTVTTKLQECIPCIKQDIDNAIVKAAINEAIASPRKN